MVIPYVAKAPEYTYEDEKCRCHFYLKDTGIYWVELSGEFTLSCAHFIIETVPILQNWLRSQSAFIYLVVNIDMDSAETRARNHILRHLRWKTSGRALKAYAIFKVPLAATVFNLLRKLNYRTVFEICDSPEDALADIAHQKTLDQQQKPRPESLPAGLSPAQELQVYRQHTPEGNGSVRFYQPDPATLYLCIEGHVSRDLLRYTADTTRALAQNLESQNQKFALMVDFSRQISVSKKVILSTYKYSFEKNPHRVMYLIGPENTRGLDQWIVFILTHFFKDAYRVLNYEEAHHHFYHHNVHLPTTQNSLHSREFQTPEEKLKGLEELCRQQKRFLEEQTEQHHQELHTVRQVLWQLLERESNESIDIPVPEEESPIGEVLNLLNVFQRDQAELIQDLQEQVHERTRAEQEAASANAVKGQFLAAMSHEIRTPLNAILGFTRVLQINKEQNLSSAQKKYLERIRDNGAHLLQLINDVLDLSHLEAGKMPLYQREFDVAQTVRGVAKQLEVLATNKGLTVYLSLPEGQLYTDEKRLRQVIVNLLNNAIKYTPQGHIKIRLDIKNTRAMALHIEDTGPGISEKEQARIFEAFEQIKTPEGNPEEGAGLGLAISASLCQRLGFQLTLHSTPGEGSCFSIHF